MELQAWRLEHAVLASKRGTCGRRQVGCALFDERGHLLSTGYNGPPSGVDHCITKACSGRHAAPGTGLELCEAVHAEANALIQCHDPFKIKYCYVTNSPCIHCVKLLLNTSCEIIVFNERYAHDTDAMRLWLRVRQPGSWLLVNWHEALPAPDAAASP